MFGKFFNCDNRSVSVNGVVYKGTGDISISNGKITIGGKDVTPDGKHISIEVNGNIKNLDIDCCESIKVNGSCEVVGTKNGNVTCGDVGGDVTTKNGNVTCRSVEGSVETRNGNIIKGSKK